MSRAHAAGARLREGKGFSRAGAGRDSVGSRMCSGRGTAKIWTWAALQREMSTTGRGSPGRESPPETGSDPAQGGVPGKQQSQQPSPGDTKQGG